MVYKGLGVVLEVEVWNLVVVVAGLLSPRADVASVMLYVGDLR